MRPQRSARGSPPPHPCQRIGDATASGLTPTTPAAQASSAARTDLRLGERRFASRATCGIANSLAAAIVLGTLPGGSVRAAVVRSARRGPPPRTPAPEL